MLSYVAFAAFVGLFLLLVTTVIIQVSARGYPMGMVAVVAFLLGPRRTA